MISALIIAITISVAMGSLIASVCGTTLTSCLLPTKHKANRAFDLINDPNNGNDTLLTIPNAVMHMHRYQPGNIERCRILDTLERYFISSKREDTVRDRVHVSGLPGIGRGPTLYRRNSRLGHIGIGVRKGEISREQFHSHFRMGWRWMIRAWMKSQVGWMIGLGATAISIQFGRR